MKRTAGLQVVKDDRLLKRWWTGRDDRFYTQRKRLPNSATPIAKAVQEEYLKSMVAAIKFIKYRFNLGVGASINALRYLRGEEQRGQHQVAVAWLKDTFGI